MIMVWPSHSSSEQEANIDKFTLELITIVYNEILFNFTTQSENISYAIDEFYSIFASKCPVNNFVQTFF